MRRQARGSAEPAAGAPRGRHRAARARGRDPGSHLGEMCAEAAVLAGRAEARTPSELPFCWAACGREVPFPTVADGHFLAMPRPATIARRDRLRRYTTRVTANQGSARRIGSLITGMPLPCGQEARDLNRAPDFAATERTALGDPAEPCALAVSCAQDDGAAARNHRLALSPIGA